MGANEAVSIRVSRLCERFERALQVGDNLAIEKLVVEVEQDYRGELLRELIQLELRHLRINGQRPDIVEYRRRFTSHAEIVDKAFAEELSGADDPGEQRLKLSTIVLSHAGQSDTNKGPTSQPSTEQLPARIGRYVVQRSLGSGGFGQVFLARDELLDRLVAIKVPRHQLVQSSADAELYLAEARAVAQLDHPHIVPVFDFGTTDEFPCYIVSKYVSGESLAQRICQQRIPMLDAAELVGILADALHYAHRQGLVHRDVKPGNILLDSRRKPYLVDFGLALREQDLGKGPRYAGTPA